MKTAWQIGAAAHASSPEGTGGRLQRVPRHATLASRRYQHGKEGKARHPLGDFLDRRRIETRIAKQDSLAKRSLAYLKVDTTKQARPGQGGPHHQARVGWEEAWTNQNQKTKTRVDEDFLKGRISQTPNEPLWKGLLLKVKV